MLLIPLLELASSLEFEEIILEILLVKSVDRCSFVVQMIEGKQHVLFETFHERGIPLRCDIYFHV